ncbi:hypothetical protein TcBrA4_0000920 [Trypanosoma cruzi]|nr:hypothetical protein TcBrA4_0000920 [Trypanosoma cruzi]
MGNHHQCPGVTVRNGHPSTLRSRRCRGPSLHQHVGAVGTVGGNELAHRATVPWAQLAPGRDGTRPFYFQGHSIIWRTHSRRVALREEEDCLPRRRVDVCTSSLGWIRRRMNPTARDCVGELWENAAKTRHLDERRKEIEFADFLQRALLVERAFILSKALEGPVRTEMAVHRMAKTKERPGGRRGHVPPFHVSQCLGAVRDEAAALLELDASFYGRLTWRIFTDEFPLSSGICGSRGIDSPPHGPRVYSGSSLRRREGLGGGPRDGKTAVCCAARGEYSCLDLRYPDQWTAEKCGSAVPMCGQEVAPAGEQVVLAKGCESIGVSFIRETKSAALSTTRARGLRKTACLQTPAAGGVGGAAARGIPLLTVAFAFFNAVYP